MAKKTLPSDFASRRLHSLMGLWLVIYLFEHLLVNSQAALLIGADGRGFIHMVNGINDLPYLPVIEIAILGVPILLHAIWGIHYIWQAKYNSTVSDGRRPNLQRLSRNHAFTWQRLTAWILLIGIILHVVQMRFVERPVEVNAGGTERLFVSKLGMDEGLYTVAARLGVTLMDRAQIEEMAEAFKGDPAGELSDELERAQDKSAVYNAQTARTLDTLQSVAMKGELIQALLNKLPNEKQVAAVADQFGKAELLVVRNVFKDPWMIFFYTVFVLAAVYHAFRGLWSFLIVWGINLSRRSQHLAAKLSVGLMVLVGFMGLAAVWLTYWVNLRH